MRKEREIRSLIIASIVCVSVLIILLVAFLMINLPKKENENNFASQLSNQEEMVQDSETASTEIGKTVDEAEAETGESDDEVEYETAEVILEENTVEIEEKVENIAKEEKEVNNIEEQNTVASSVTQVEEKSENDKEEEESQKVTFEAPIKGEILKEFATDSLVYSDTLKEWITHNGIDIKADKTSVVGAASAGTVYAIKNDPRYGLTVIINHDNGYQTVYSNLLTAEFVVQGEKVEKGQSIGTVGNSASFEIADDYHLHFELLSNNEYVDPVIYMDFE